MEQTSKRQMYKTPQASFAARTTRDDNGCLLWTGATRPNGYGVIWDGERVTRAHRWAWEQKHGPIPDGMDLDHICGNRACVDHTHLRPTTRKQNMENLRRANINSPSGVRGVHPEGSRWRVRVKHHYREYYGGTFDTVAEAETAAIALRNSLFTHNDADKAA